MKVLSNDKYNELIKSIKSSRMSTYFHQEHQKDILNHDLSWKGLTHKVKSDEDSRSISER